MLSIGSTTDAGLAAHARNWEICEEVASAHGRTVSRERWRVVSMMHIAESRAQARRDVAFGLEPWLRYFREVTTFPVVPEGVPDSIDYLIENGIATIGTPEDAIAAIERLWEGSRGGFGCFMLFAHNWADWAATRRSYELIARYVMPHFQAHLEPRRASYAFSAERHAELAGEAREAVQGEIERYQAEKAARGGN